jgi:diacylglycerol kinase (ATP)
MDQKGFSIGRLIRSFGYALKGIASAYSKGQVNIKIHTCIAILTIALSIWLSISAFEWVCIVLCIGLVIAAEMTNSAIEALVDLVSPEWHKKAGIVKDIAAGAVLILAATSVVVGTIIFLPKIIALFY